MNRTRQWTRKKPEIRFWTVISHLSMDIQIHQHKNHEQDEIPYTILYIRLCQCIYWLSLQWRSKYSAEEDAFRILRAFPHGKNVFRGWPDKIFIPGLSIPGRLTFLRLTFLDMLHSGGGASLKSCIPELSVLEMLHSGAKLPLKAEFRGWASLKYCIPGLRFAEMLHSGADLRWKAALEGLPSLKCCIPGMSFPKNMYSGDELPGRTYLSEGRIPGKRHSAIKNHRSEL